jgi:hypothetical protein
MKIARGAAHDFFWVIETSGGVQPWIGTRQKPARLPASRRILGENGGHWQYVKLREITRARDIQLGVNFSFFRVYVRRLSVELRMAPAPRVCQRT